MPPTRKAPAAPKTTRTAQPVTTSVTGAGAIVASLAAAGSEQAALRLVNQLARKINVDHALALKLWDATALAPRLLALLIADPTAMAPSDLDRWCAQCNDGDLLVRFTRFAAGSPHAVERAHRWLTSRAEHERGAGWQCLAWLVLEGRVDVEDARALLRKVEDRFANEQEPVREGMIPLLVFIGQQLPVCAREVAELCDRLDIMIELSGPGSHPNTESSTEPNTEPSTAPRADHGSRRSVKRDPSPKAKPKAKPSDNPKPSAKTKPSAKINPSTLTKPTLKPKPTSKPKSTAGNRAATPAAQPRRNALKARA